MIKRLLACLVLCVPWLVSAEKIPDLRLAKDDPCGPFEVVHINGVLTDRNGALANLARIAAVYGDGHDGHVITYRLAHNQTQGLIDDLIEVWNLKIAQDATLTYSVFVKLINGLIQPTVLQDKLMKEIAAILNTYELKPITQADPAVALIAAQIRAPLQLPKYKTVIVGHSQGTSYAVEVMKRLIAGTGLAHAVPAESISMVSLGAAAGTVMGPSASHATSRNDYVIGALRRFSIPVGFTVLGNNITIPVLPADWLGHNLIRVYMAHAAGRNAMNSKLNAALTAVKSPAPPPNSWIQSRAHLYRCGPLPWPQGPGPWSCYASIPMGSFPTWHSQDIIFYSIALIPEQQQRFGQWGELEAYVRSHQQTCYNWYISDRIAVIQSGLGIYYPYHTLGSCGAGYPWQTPYNNADVAWMIHSADSSEVRFTEWSEGPPFSGYVDYTQVTMHPVCRRAS